MHQIKRTDAFLLVVKALENNDEKRASKMMQVIVNSIRKCRKENKDLSIIEINSEKDAQLFKDYWISE
ncbi:MAG TPA: hypothetical protein H9699_03365 [Candidatus Gemmiger stercoravium]|nr:hypothetical protein [Candidatus Gemmiger stercoravium]